MDPAQALSRRLRAAVRDERVLSAIASVPRELFVGDAEYHRACENVALPIECGQTISQPIVVARMLELLKLRPDDNVLDVGTGSGYHAALLARMVDQVVADLGSAGHGVDHAGWQHLVDQFHQSQC